MDVLVAYASKYGSTAEIARRIAWNLEEHGLAAALADVEKVSDPAPYRGVIVGSAVYAGQWRKEAADFLKTHAAELACKEVWLFSSGPTGEGEPDEILNGWRFPESLQEEAKLIQPQDITVFHGHLDPERLSFAEKMIIKTIRAPTGDYRDWDLVDSWARQVTARLGKSVLSMKNR